MKRTKLLTLLLVIALVIMSAAFSACGVDLAASAGNISADNLGESSLDETTDDFDDGLDESSTEEEDPDLYEYDAEYSDDIEEETGDSEGITTTYVLNTNTLKFHYPDCRSVKQMKDKNKLTEETTREDLISRGYDPCGNCNP